MKAVVIGASGLVGGALLRQLKQRHRARGFDRDCKDTDLKGSDSKDTDLKGSDSKDEAVEFADITRRQATLSLLEREKPDWAFVPAYIPNVEFCEKDPDAAARVNIYGIRNVVDACLAAGCGLVFYSSDYIFDGTAGPYTEEDFANPLSAYGAQKLAAEHYILARAPLFKPGFVIARTTWVFGWERRPKNFAARFVGTLRQGQTWRVPTDQFGNPTYAESLAEMSIALAEQGARGIYNVAGREVVSRHGFALRIASHFGLDPALALPVATSQLGQRARRPLDGGFVTDKVQQATGIRSLDVDEALARMKKEEPQHG